MFTEIVLVDGAIRGIAISLWFCIMATIIFTGEYLIYTKGGFFGWDVFLVGFSVKVKIYNLLFR